MIRIPIDWGGLALAMAPALGKMFCALIGMRIAFLALRTGVERLRDWFGIVDEVSVKVYDPSRIRRVEDHGNGITAYHMKGGGMYLVGEDGSFSHVDRYGRWT